MPHQNGNLLLRNPIDICKQLFAQKSNCDTHKRIHNGEKLFQCDICNISFGRKFNLVRHKRIHTREKTFHCDILAKYL